MASLTHHRCARLWISAALLALALAGAWSWQAGRESAPESATPLAVNLPSRKAFPAVAEGAPIQTAAVPETRTAPVLPALPAGTRGFRSGARGRYVALLEAEAASSAQLRELEALANSGDADAAGALADHYSSCAFARGLGAPEANSYWPIFQQEANLGAATIARVRSENTALASRCARLSGRDPEALGHLRHAWMLRAAALGDPASVVRQPIDSPGMQVNNDLRRNAEVLLLSENGPEALVEHAHLWAFSTRYSMAAYAMAACGLIEACAADVEGFSTGRVTGRQIFGFSGGFLLLRTLSPRDRQIASGQSSEIMRLWQARQFAQLVEPLPPRAPPRRP